MVTDPVATAPGAVLVEPRCQTFCLRGSCGVRFQGLAHASVVEMKSTVAKNREAGFGPASHRLAETFSLCRSLSSPQQPIAVGPAFYSQIKIRQCKKTCKFLSSHEPARLWEAWRLAGVVYTQSTWSPGLHSA